MRGGRLRNKVVLQQPNPTTDSYGQPVYGWATVATIWAAVEPLNGREFFTAQQINAEMKVRIRIRYGSEWASITAAWRVTFNNKTYDIVEIIQPKEINQEIILMCSQGVNEGG